jgi:tetratricopeptide (TPR) repeat protein
MGGMDVSRLALLLFAAASLAQAHEHPADGPAPAQLGAVSFETSCKPEVAGDFNQGVALLHSFWHDEAGRTFEKVAAADPDCAMAYWGQAMASFHPYASTPTAEDLAAGRRALTRGDTAREKSAREAAYLHAVGLLYAGYEPARDFVYARKFSTAMGALVAAYPDDIEARAFYALALLASDAPGDTSLANSKKAVVILYPLMRQHPGHPGFAHYIIHACDNPEMAQRGAEAARRYASIAPAAPHALHMPSHIFARLGLWQDDIRSNLASKAAAESATGMHVGAENRLHAMEFLEYAYLQRGQYDEARAIATEAPGVNAADTRYADYYLTVQARFPTLLAIETQDWSIAAALQPVAGAHWYSHAQTLLANAIAAGHRRDADAGKKAADTVDQLLAKVPQKIPQGSSSANVRDEVYAWAAFSRRDVERAIRLLRPIAKRQAKAGKGEVELPAREMLAEMLLLEGKPREALEEYRASLRTDPNRFNALVGATMAAEQSGGRELATEFRHPLSVLCPDANGSALTTLVSLNVCSRR